jgi:hypothetical protein
VISRSWGNDNGGIARNRDRRQKLLRKASAQCGLLYVPMVVVVVMMIMKAAGAELKTLPPTCANCL